MSDVMFPDAMQDCCHYYQGLACHCGAVVTVETAENNQTSLFILCPKVMYAIGNPLEILSDPVIVSYPHMTFLRSKAFSLHVHVPFLYLLVCRLQLVSKDFQALREKKGIHPTQQSKVLVGTVVRQRPEDLQASREFRAGMDFQARQAHQALQ